MFVARVLQDTGEVAHGLMRLVGYPDRNSFAGRVDNLARHQALVAGSSSAGSARSGWPSLVATSSCICRKLGNELAFRHLRGGESQGAPRRLARHRAIALPHFDVSISDQSLAMMSSFAAG